MRLPILDYNYNSETMLDPDGALVILDNLELLVSIVEKHIQGEVYLHESRHILHKDIDVKSQIDMYRNQIGELRGKVSTVSSKANRLNDRCKEILEIVDKLTFTSLNGLVGDITVRAYAGSDMMVGNALDRKEITIANTQPVANKKPVEGEI